MSITARDWAWNRDLPGAVKIVLLALAEHADDLGICWPSLNTLAKECGLSRATICRHLDTLKDAGLIQERAKQHRENGSNASTQYRLSLPLYQPDTRGVSQDDTTLVSECDKPLSQPDTTLVSERYNHTNRNSNRHLEPSLEPSDPLAPLSQAVAPHKTDAKKPKADKPPPDPRVAETLHALEGLQGYKFRGRDAMLQSVAIKRLLTDGVEPDTVLGCWKALKAQTWRTTPVGADTVEKNLGEYQAGRLTQQPRAAPPAVGPPQREAQRPTGELVFNIRNRPRPAEGGSPP